MPGIAIRVGPKTPIGWEGWYMHSNKLVLPGSYQMPNLMIRLRMDPSLDIMTGGIFAVDFLLSFGRAFGAYSSWVSR